jgi:hypothetical protein
MTRRIYVHIPWYWTIKNKNTRVTCGLCAAVLEAWEPYAWNRGTVRRGCLEPGEYKNVALDDILADISNPRHYLYERFRNILNQSIEQSRAQHETDVCLQHRTGVKKRLSLVWFHPLSSRVIIIIIIPHLLFSVVHHTQSSRVP